MLKFFDLRNILNHTWFLENNPSCKATKHLKNKLNLRIYQRTEENFFVSKSFIWRWEAIDNTWLTKLFSFEIVLLFLCLAYKTLVSLKFQVKKSVKTLEKFLWILNIVRLARDQSRSISKFILKELLSHMRNYT